MVSVFKSCFYVVVLTACLLITDKSVAQSADTVSTFSITAYVDAYYAHYRDSAKAGDFQKFTSVSPRNNSPSLNTAQVAFQYTADKIRATAVLQYGDIANSSWPRTYNNIQEAHVGFKIYSKLWIDAGFFRTHFGTEFLLPSENITTSLAVGTYYEPFYESGIRLNFDPTTQLEINLFLLNGYNMFVDNNNKKSFGMGVTYVLNDNFNVGYTNYIGDDTPEGIPQSHLRIAQNIFLNYQHKKIKVQLGADYYLQQHSEITDLQKTASMYSALATVKYQCTKKFAVYARGEVFQDPDGFVSTIITDNAGHLTGYKLYGITAGVEYKPTAASYVRLEGRDLQMNKDQYIFNYNDQQYNYRTEIMVNAGMTFDLLKSIKRRTDL